MSSAGGYVPPEPIYVMVTGSRNWTSDYDGVVSKALRDAADVLAQNQRPFTLLTLLSGGARGLDKLASGLWRSAQLGGTKEVLPDWSGPCQQRCPPGHRKLNSAGFEYCPGAGFYRNSRMIEMRPVLVLAFFRPCEKYNCPKKGRHDSHGTTQAVEEARAAGITVWTYRA